MVSPRTRRRWSAAPASSSIRGHSPRRWARTRNASEAGGGDSRRAVSNWTDSSGLISSTFTTLTRRTQLTIAIEQEAEELIELLATVDEARRQVGGHERHPRDGTGALEVVDERPPFLLQVVEMDLTHPPRQDVELDPIRGTPQHRIDADA